MRVWGIRKRGDFGPIVAAGFLVPGAVAGIVMIAQMAFLARIHEHQGTAMGLFTTMSYNRDGGAAFYRRDCC